MFERAALSLGSALLALGCAAPPTDVVDEDESAIVHGEVSNPTEDAVVRLVVGAAHDEVCTGTLIAPNAVLTARHCVARRRVGEPRPTCRVEGFEGVAETTPDEAYDGNVDVRTVAVTAGLTFDPDRAPQAYGRELFTDGAGVMCEHDIAVIVLDRSLTLAPPRAVRREPPRPGEPLTAVGWGFTDAISSMGTPVLPTTRMKRADVRVLSGASEVIRYVRQSGAVIIAGAMSGEFLVGESVCNGDSGGPLFDAEGRIVGVTSRRVSSLSRRCVDSPNVFSHPGADAHFAIIESALARAEALAGSVP